MLIGTTTGHSRPLAACGDQRDCVLLGIRPSFHLADRFLPIRPHVVRERSQPAHIVGARHLEKEVDVGNCALGAAPEPLSQLRTYVERCNALGK
jgi:hypothetical protein